MIKIVGIVVAVIAVVAVTGLVFFGGNEESATQNSTSQSQTQTQTANESDVDQSLVVDMSDFEFSVTTINAAPGETISVELTNSGGVHNFEIEELDVLSDTINNGESTTVTFTIPQDAAGETYDFFCNISNHRAQGMEGQLVISS